MKNLLSIALLATQGAGESTSLTVYSTAAPGAIPPELYRPSPNDNPYANPYGRPPVPGYAVVRQERPLTLSAARGPVRFSDVAALLDPTTVSFASLTDPAGTSVLEQSYQFDLVSPQRLLERYLDKKISGERPTGNGTAPFTGTLLSSYPQITLKSDSGGVEILSGYSRLDLPELPGGLLTRPTLLWDVVTSQSGPHRVRVSYHTRCITWRADYNVVFAEGKDANSCVLDVAAWVSLLNQSGAGYPEAKLKLIAGDVQRAQPPPSAMAARKSGVAWE